MTSAYADVCRRTLLISGVVQAVESIGNTEADVLGAQFAAAIAEVEEVMVGAAAAVKQRVAFFFPWQQHASQNAEALDISTAVC
jgi:hypothetical protein